MKATPKQVLGVGVATLAILAGLAVWLGELQQDKAHSESSPQKIELTAGTLYSTRLTDTAGKEHVVGQWQHQVLVINFWATWCTPCKEEMPMFAKMQAKYRHRGLQIIGIAVDSRENVINFSQNSTTAYPLFPEEQGAIEMSRRFGNRLGVLPYTIFVRPGGEIFFTRTGIISELEFVELMSKNL